MKFNLRSKNYLFTFSKWIANLGVVPLLLFLAFLLCPAFTFFASLLFLVTRVFETIFKLLFNLRHRGFLHKVGQKKSILKLLVLPRALTHVKGLALFCLHLVVMQSSKTHAVSINQQLGGQHLTLAKGEILTLPIAPSAKFTVANKEVVSVKLTNKGNSLLIKGRSLGVSDLIIWPMNPDQQPRHFHVNVLRKQSFQKLALIKNRLIKQGLNSRIEGESLYLSGEISTLHGYKTLVSFKESIKDRLVLESIGLTNSLKKKVYAHFLEVLMKRGILNLNCELPVFSINCFETKEMSSTIKELSNQFFITSISSEAKNKSRQFKVSLTLQQFESSRGEVFSLGLDKLQANWQQIIETNPLALIKSNTISLSNNSYKSKTIAKPQITGRLNHPITIKIGQEISFFQNSDQENILNRRIRQWKFAGLLINIELKTLGEDLQVFYKNSLSRPEQDIITTNGQQSSIILSPGSSHILFNIGFQTNKRDLSRFPLLSKIPLLGSLFRNSAKNSTYKKILCLIKVEEI